MLNILITGATGNVGREVTGLLSAYEGIRIATRDPLRARQTLGNQINAVSFDLAQPETFAAAFKGIQRVFLVRPPDVANVRQQIVPALNAAKTAGVEQIVFLSILGADRNRFIPHHAIEQAIAQLDIPGTFLRASFFMQNLNNTHRAEIQRGELLVPAGNGRTSFIDVRDIAEVAVKALTEDGHRHRAYDLTGAAALTYDEVAEIFTEVLGKPVRYAHASIWRFIREMTSRGLPLNFVLIMVGIYTTARLGLAGEVTDEVARLLGRSPISLRQYVEDYRSCWV
ncbi:MAG: SDR family oxidoreductase [Oculatellaceae cyanobacterium Prado106]|nr:SDR family oxidoreductase [Oculatellaceae cyanobacterium Prado106]